MGFSLAEIMQDGVAFANTVAAEHTSRLEREELQARIDAAREVAQTRIERVARFVLDNFEAGRPDEDIFRVVSLGHCDAEAPAEPDSPELDRVEVRAEVSLLQRNRRYEAESSLRNLTLGDLGLGSYDDDEEDDSFEEDPDTDEVEASVADIDASAAETDAEDDETELDAVSDSDETAEAEDDDVAEDHDVDLRLVDAIGIKISYHHTRASDGAVRVQAGRELNMWMPVFSRLSLPVGKKERFDAERIMDNITEFEQGYRNILELLGIESPAVAPEDDDLLEEVDAVLADTDANREAPDADAQDGSEDGTGTGTKTSASATSPMQALYGVLH